MKVTRTKWLADARGAVVERSLRPEPLADVSTAYHIHLALTRRGIAAELAGVLSFMVHEDLRNTLMNALIDVPPDSRYQRLSLEHVREVDSFVWSQLVKEASQEIRADGGLGVPPLDELMKKVLQSHEVAMRLLPLAKGGGGSAGNKGKGGSSSKREVGDSSGEEGDCGPGSGRVSKRQWHRAVKKARIEGEKSVRKLDQLKASKAARSGEAEGKGKGKAFNPLPKPLVGGVAVTPDGKRLCYGFNLNECKDASPGEKCGRGWHSCTRVGCHGPHSALKCQVSSQVACVTSLSCEKHEYQFFEVST